MSSYLLAINIHTTPQACRSQICSIFGVIAKYESRRETAAKNADYEHLKLVITSTIQSIIQAQREGVISCQLRNPLSLKVSSLSSKIKLFKISLP